MKVPISGLTVFFPCYNDAATIGKLIAGADSVAGEFTDDYEILVVDDGSRDDSRQVVTGLLQKYPKLRLIAHDKNKGYGAALRTGFSSASKEFVFYTDGDGQYDVLELRGLLNVMDDSSDIVNGYKIRRNDPLFRIWLGRFYQGLLRRFFGFKVRDLSCDFRLFRRRVFDRIELRCSSGAVCLELVKKAEQAGFRILDFPVHHYRRPYGRSQFFRPRRLYETCKEVVGLRGR